VIRAASASGVQRVRADGDSPFELVVVDVWRRRMGFDEPVR
jgi:hypothetical protein